MTYIIAIIISNIITMILTYGIVATTEKEVIEKLINILKGMEIIEIEKEEE